MATVAFPSSSRRIKWFFPRGKEVCILVYVASILCLALQAIRFSGGSISNEVVVPSVSVWRSSQDDQQIVDSPPALVPVSAPAIVAVKKEVQSQQSNNNHTDRLDRLDALLVKEKIHPVAFKVWNSSLPLPCYEGKQRSPRRGFIFIKPMKAGSTTGASITLRIATNLGLKKLGYSTMCRSFTRHRSGNAMGVGRDLNPDETFVWSLTRDPTRRTISEYFHFYVSRLGKSVDDKAFQQFLKDNRNYRDFFLKWLMVKERPPPRKPVPNPVKTINNILGGYNFLGIIERAEESTVILQMLLGLNTSDVAFLKSKSSGSYDDGKFRNTCFMIPKVNISSGMEEYFNSAEYKQSVYYDELLHHAVNRSIDKTIEYLGRTKFDSNLRRFREAQKLISQQCTVENVRYPCTATGKRRLDNETDCVMNDWGCGFDCIDKVLLQHNYTESKKNNAADDARIATV